MNSFMNEHWGLFERNWEYEQEGKNIRQDY